jgi:hypothetical protein
MESPHQPRIKTPEELARELEERLQQEAIRARRWRQRREAYRVITILAGLLLPSMSLTLAGMISNDGFLRWIDRSGWWPLLITACGGGLASASAFVWGWGVARSMMLFGGLFMLVVALNQARLGTLVIAMPGLVALFVSTGALVGHLITMEEEG